MQQNTLQYTVTDENQIDKIPFYLKKGDRVWLTGDLGAGKSTLMRHILRRQFEQEDLIVRSPTYTYYQRYDTPLRSSSHIPNTRPLSSTVISIDSSYDTWTSIGGKELHGDPDIAMCIEWPEILGSHIIPTHQIHIEVGEDGGRIITIKSGIH